MSLDEGEEVDTVSTMEGSLKTTCHLMRNSSIRSRDEATSQTNHRSAMTELHGSKGSTAMKKDDMRRLMHHDLSHAFNTAATVEQKVHRQSPS